MLAHMATTTKRSARLNLSFTPEERRVLEKLANAEKRDITWLAVFFMQIGMRFYQECDTNVMEMCAIPDFNELLFKARVRKRLKAAERRAERRLRISEGNDDKAENHNARKQAQG